MASRSYSGRESVHRQVTISDGARACICSAMIDAGDTPGASSANDLGGMLNEAPALWQHLCAADKLTMTVEGYPDPYRMILDSVTGRFIAHRL